MTRLLLAMIMLLCWPTQPLHARDAAQAVPEDRQILVLLRSTPARYRADTQYGGGDYGEAARRAALIRRARRIARAHEVEYLDVWPMPILQLDCLILAAPDADSVQALADAIARDDDVEWAQPVRLYRTLQGAKPYNDTLYDDLPYNDPLFPVAPAARQWKLAELHRIATGKGVSIAVIDTGIDVGHPDLAGQVSTQRDFAPTHAAQAERHGTEVAGVIAAKANNRIGMVGVSPGARLLALRACWQSGAARGAVCDSLSLAKALHFAIERDVQVINMSLSGPPDRLLGALIDRGLARRMSIVASVDPAAANGGFPASHTGVIAVADAASGGVPAGAMRAPGSDIPTTRPEGKWHLVTGSSFAAAHVAGLVALMREQRKRGTPGARPLKPTTGQDALIDPRASLIRTDARCSSDCAASRRRQR